MMCHGNLSGVERETECFKVGIAKLACCHLYADTVEGSKGCCVEMNTMKWDIQCLTKVFTETFIPVRLPTPQMKIAMDSLYPVA